MYRRARPQLHENPARATSTCTPTPGRARPWGKELAGRAGARLQLTLAAGLSHHTALRILVRIPLPAGRVPRVIGVDDFALRRRHRYATLVIDTETHERIDVLPDRMAGMLEAWLRGHPGIRVVCRDGSTTYAEVIRRALPDAVQVADRWHLWHNLCEAALSEVKAHSTCWAAVLDAPIYDGPRAQSTLERWHQVHGLLEKGAGCSMRPPSATRPEHCQTLRASRPARARAPRPQIPREPRGPLPRAPARAPSREPRRPRPASLRGDQGPRLHRLPQPPAQHINQGRADADRSHISPRRLARMLLTRPDNLKAEHHELLTRLTAACTETTQLAPAVRNFVPLLSPHAGNADALTRWAPGSATPTCLTCMPLSEAWNETARPWAKHSRSQTATVPSRVSTPRPSASHARCTDEQASLCSATASRWSRTRPDADRPYCASTARARRD